MDGVCACGAYILDESVLTKHTIIFSLAVTSKRSVRKEREQGSPNLSCENWGSLPEELTTLWDLKGQQQFARKGWARRAFQTESSTRKNAELG